MSKPRRVALFAVFATVLLVTAMPASAAGLKLGSIHNTDDDFRDGETGDWAISGTGTSAELVNSTPKINIRFEDSFEDEAADSGDPEDWGTSSAPSAGQSVSTDRAYEGTQSYKSSNSPGVSHIFPLEQPYSQNITQNVSYAVYLDSTSAGSVTRAFTGGSSGSVVWRIIFVNGGLSFDGDGGTQKLSNDVVANEWLFIKVYNIDNSSNTLSVMWESPSDSGDVDGLSYKGTGNGYDYWDMGTDEGTTYHDSVTFGDQVNEFPMTYVSANHSVSEPVEGFVNITSNTDANLTVRFEGWNGTGWDTLNETTDITTTGNKTFSFSDPSYTKVRTNITAFDDGSDPQVNITAEGVNERTEAPEVDNSSADPQGGTVFEDPDVTASIDIQDSDFPNDTVTVDWTLDGNVVATTTITSNGTVSNTFTALGDGSHTWVVNATDAYANSTVSQDFTFEVNHTAPIIDNSSASPTGDAPDDTVNFEIDISDRDFADSPTDNVTVKFRVDGDVKSTKHITSNGTVTSDSIFLLGGKHTWSVNATDNHSLTTISKDFTIKLPANLTVRTEREDHTKITGANITVKFYEQTTDDPKIFSATDANDNGNISLANLEVGSTFVAYIQADGFHSRAVLVESLFEQQQAFLLNKSADDRFVTFQIEDRTGNYGKDGEFVIDRAINESLYDSTENNESAWLAVAGDQIGPHEEFSAHLEQGTRYRIRVIGEDGRQRVLGSYVPQSNTTEVIEIGEISWPEPEGESQLLVANTTDDRSQIQIFYVDSADNTTNLNITVWERGNRSNEILSDQPAGTFGSYSNTISLTGDQQDKTWVINASYDHEGEPKSQQRLVGGSTYTLPGADWLTGSLVFIMLSLTAALYGPRTASMGAVTVTAIASIIAALQLYTISPPLITVAWIISVGGLLYTEGVRP